MNKHFFKYYVKRWLKQYCKYLIACVGFVVAILGMCCVNAVMIAVGAVLIVPYYREWKERNDYEQNIRSIM